MPDGQTLSSPAVASHHATIRAVRAAGLRAGPTPHQTASEAALAVDVLAQNALLRSALVRQRGQMTELRRILCSMDVAMLCVGPDLALRFYTANAGALLGIGPHHLGRPLCLPAVFAPGFDLTDCLQTVLASGIGQSQSVRQTDGVPLLCRVLPLCDGPMSASCRDGLVITFAPTNSTGPDAQLDAPVPPGDGGLAAGYPDLGCGLTRRQHQVLGHVLAGHPSKNIAADLGISRRTVENHRAAIMARTGATSLPALARLAIGADVGGDCRPAPAARSAR
ncbi:MAG: hypothetical protein CFE32_05580 [Alphaproteobacteria bacterium PA3]|nr:MAG: hypothetical protein CFE32_05580 [Alphaproteobacteria bacterium PA3]